MKKVDSIDAKALHVGIDSLSSESILDDTEDALTAEEGTRLISEFSYIKTIPLLYVYLNNLIENNLHEKLDAISTSLVLNAYEGHVDQNYQQSLLDLMHQPSFKALRLRINKLRTSTSSQLMEKLKTEMYSMDDEDVDHLTRKKSKTKNHESPKSFSLFALLDTCKLTPKPNRVTVFDILSLYTRDNMSPHGWGNILEKCQQVDDIEALIVGDAFFDNTDKDQDLERLWDLILQGVCSTVIQETILYGFVEIHRTWFSLCERACKQNHSFDGDESDFISCQIDLLLNISLALRYHAIYDGSEQLLSSLLGVFHYMVVSSDFTSTLTSKINLVSSRMEERWVESVSIVLHLVLCYQSADEGQCLGTVCRAKTLKPLRILSNLDPSAQWFASLMNTLPSPFTFVELVEGTGLLQSLLYVFEESSLVGSNELEESSVMEDSSSENESANHICKHLLFILGAIFFNVGATVSNISWNQPSLLSLQWLIHELDGTVFLRPRRDLFQSIIFHKNSVDASKPSTVASSQKLETITGLFRKAVTIWEMNDVSKS